MFVSSLLMAVLTSPGHASAHGKAPKPLVARNTKTSRPDWPMTRAERTNYAETSHYSDVIDFIKGLQNAGAPVRLQYIGKSTEGKPMPLVIVARPPVSSAAEARKLGKPVVYVQANIHAGEVEGKEAIQHLIRRYCQEKTGILDKIVIVSTPIYNIDGNEKFGPQNRNRPGQGGPELVGLRANGQNLDLNRDYIKAETPEFNAGLKWVYNTWDPEVMMDLHTTDGTRHGYPLTWSPPLNPDTESGVRKYAQDVMMASIRKGLSAKYKLDTFDYGNAEKHGDVTAWYEVGPEGRYSTNYVGLRNRIGVLSEALTYLSFKDRITATERFTDAVLQWTADHAKEVLTKTREADKNVVAWGLDPSKAPPMGVRFDFQSRGVEGVMLEKKTAKHEGVPTDLEPVKMDVYDRFKSTKTSPFPAAYFLPEDEIKTADLLVKHGVHVERLDSAWAGQAEVFEVSEFHQDAQPFQGHKLQRLEGKFRPEAVNVNAGGFLVRTSQPLGILTFHILEPESLDGAMAWGFMGEKFEVNASYPVYKVMKPVTATTSRYTGP